MAVGLERKGLEVINSREGLVDIWTQDQQRFRYLLWSDVSSHCRTEKPTVRISTVNDFVGAFHII